jgi:hypothetical protein
MTGRPAGGAPAPKRRISLESLFTRRNMIIGAATLLVLLVALAAVHYHSGSNRRRYDSLLMTSLDRIVTAQEGFYYDSTKYVTSLRALPTVHLPPGVHVTLYTPDRRSWWGIATHDGTPAHHCVVWVGQPPSSIPLEARAPENETKPLCFDDNVSVARQAQRS